MMQLEGQVAVITGGTRGLGFGIATAFIAEGAKVVMGGRSAGKGKRAVDELNVLSGGDNAGFVPCDVRQRSEVEALVDGAVETHGRLDIMVNNAGGSDGFALVHEMTDEAWENALNWNLNAVFWGTRRALRYMLPASYGRIINMSSVEGKHANKPMVGHYITNKHAINGFTKVVAYEYGPQGINCNAIAPGAVETDLMKTTGAASAEAAGMTYQEFLDGYAQESMTKRLNTVEEVSAVALLLAGEQGKGITGTVLNVDGGTSQS